MDARGPLSILERQAAYASALTCPTQPAMWINAEVDLPQSLISAHREGRLVVFAGAGVSMGPPSNLPNFEELVNRVAAGVLARNDGEALDAFLGRLEGRRIDVQSRTREALDRADSKPRVLHERILRLFANEQTARIVTTNFDRHFTTAAQTIFPTLDHYVGPAIPLGRDTAGLIYLHGAVEKASSRLVLTDRDFGQAYLSDGWATRFLMEMFSTFAVLFIGYSHQDVVMRYLARSFAGPTERFALTPTGDEEFWNHLGIQPVGFPRREGPAPYGAIDDALHSWSTMARMGVLDHHTRIARLVETPPTPDPESTDYLRSVIGDPVRLRFFTSLAERVEWFTWASNEGFLEPLASPNVLGERDQLIATWIAEKFAIAHQRPVLEFIRRTAFQLNPFVCDAIAFSAARMSSEVPGDVLRLWAAAMLAVPTVSTSTLTRFLRKCASVADIQTTALLFRRLLQPQLRFEPPWPSDEDGPLRLSVEMGIRGPDYDLRKAWEHVILPNLDQLHDHLLPTITSYLKDASALLVAAGRADTKWDPMSYSRSAIEPHGQDHLAKDWGLLVDIARELLMWLVNHAPGSARQTVESWMRAPEQLLVRLGIFGLGELTNCDADDALAMIEQHQWLYRLSYKHEVFELLRKVFPRATDAAKTRFIEHSMTADVIPVSSAEPDHAEARRVSDYERYNVAVWLRKVASDSLATEDHFMTLQQSNPNFAPREHPDLDVWIGSGWVGPNSPKTVDELVEMQPVDAVQYLATYEPGTSRFNGPDRAGLVSVFEQTAAAHVDWSLQVANGLIEAGLWKAELWDALLAAWRSATLSADVWHEVVRIVEGHPEITMASAPQVAVFVERSAERRELLLEDIERIERLGERLLSVVGGREASVRKGDGSIEWLTSAINHPAGQVAESWITTLGRRITIAGDLWHGIPTPVKQRFDALLEDVCNNGAMGRIVFASQMHFLFGADRTWTKVTVIPLFDWDADELRARQAWDGFLAWGRWSDPLVDQLRPYLRQTFTRTAALGDDRRALASALASVAAFSTQDPWHDSGWLFEFMGAAPADDRARWADEFGRYIESLSDEGTDGLWNRWLADYWHQRATGLPQPLDEVERQAMVTWLVGLRSKFSEAISQVLATPPTTLDRFVFYRMHQAGVGRRNGRETGRLLRGLFNSLTAIAYDFGEVDSLANQAADNGAESADLLVIADHMARLGCMGATELRRRASE